MSHDHFATTRWTMVFEAGRPPSVDSDNALAGLCEAYWFPIYAYVRRRGNSKEDAEDLTQMFFSRLLDREMFAGLDRGHGRFRAFLLASLKHFLSNEWDKRRAIKRGGSITHLSLDWQSADQRFGLADNGTMTPDAEFDREWALTLLGRVIEETGREFAGQGKAAEFAALKGCLTETKDGIRYSEIAAALGIDEGTARVRAHRLRKRYRDLLKREIAATLEDPAMVEEELAVLLGAFS